MSSKGRLRNVVRMHSDLVVALEQVQLRELTGSTELIQELVYSLDGKPVADGEGIEGPIVNAKPS